MVLRTHFRKNVVAALFFASMLLGCTSAFAQIDDQDAPAYRKEVSALFEPSVSVANRVPLPLMTTSSNSLIIPAKAVPRKQHPSFFDRKNSLLIAASATAIAFDGISTERFLSNPNCHEMNPIARPFVNSRTGAAAYFGVSFAGEVFLMHLAHKHNHHLMERLIPMLVVGSESSMVYNNYSLSRR